MLYISSFRLHSSSCKYHGLLYLLHFLQNPRSRFTSSIYGLAAIQNPPSYSAGALKEWWGLGRFKWGRVVFLVRQAPVLGMKVKGLKMPPKCLQRLFDKSWRIQFRTIQKQIKEKQVSSSLQFSISEPPDKGLKKLVTVGSQPCVPRSPTFSMLHAFHPAFLSSDEKVPLCCI